jgi:hypothetical protein
MKQLRLHPYWRSLDSSTNMFSATFMHVIAVERAVLLPAMKAARKDFAFDRSSPKAQVL